MWRVCLFKVVGLNGHWWNITFTLPWIFVNLRLEYVQESWTSIQKVSLILCKYQMALFRKSSEHKTLKFRGQWTCARLLLKWGGLSRRNHLCSWYCSEYTNELWLYNIFTYFTCINLHSFTIYVNKIIIYIYILPIIGEYILKAFPVFSAKHFLFGDHGGPCTYGTHHRVGWSRWIA